MATAAMASDELSINRFNPYTWSGTFGVYSDGFPSTIPVDGSYTTEISETPTIYTDSLEGSADPNMNLSGSMYLKTADTSPAPFRGFPARKNEFPDGTVTWMRPGQPWSWTSECSCGGGNNCNCRNQKYADDTWTAVFRNKGNDILIWLMIAAIAMYVYSRLKK